MKSFQNLLRSTNDLTELNEQQLLKTKGGAIMVETQIDITANVDGVSTLLYCDRRRKRIG